MSSHHDVQSYHRTYPSKGRDPAPKFDRMRSVNEETGSPAPPPLPPAAHRTTSPPFKSASPPLSIASSNESIARGDISPSNGGRQAKRVLMASAPRRSPPPPSVPPKTRRMQKVPIIRTSSDLTYSNADQINVDKNDQLLYAQENLRAELEMVHISSKTNGNFTAVVGPVTSSPMQARPASSEKVSFNGQRRRPDDFVPSRSSPPKQTDFDNIGLEINDNRPLAQRRVAIENGYMSDHDRVGPIQRPRATGPSYMDTDTFEVRQTAYSPMDRSAPPPPTFGGPFSHRKSNDDEELTCPERRSYPWATFMMEIGALVVVLISAMVLVLAIRAEQKTLRTIMQLAYSYTYLISIVWMIWCTVDIMHFRKEWRKLTAPANDHEEYVSIAARHTKRMFYFPDTHNTGGLFMRTGAGFLCMGSLLLTAIEAVRTYAIINEGPASRDASGVEYATMVSSTKLMTYILRLIFHCGQFIFLFLYGNLVIDRYHLSAKIGLIHLVIANFCTWFEAIVFETVEQLHNTAVPTTTPIYSTIRNTTTALFSSESSSFSMNNRTFGDFAAVGAMGYSSSSSSNTSTLAVVERIAENLGVYLYPCLIEYSLISLTVFFIMWKNVGKEAGNAYSRFGHRHIYKINCSRASRGIVLGGLTILLTILALVLTYVLEEGARWITQITELVLLSVSFILVCFSFFYTTKLFYNHHAHVDAFDQVLILITTVGDFAYTLFGLIASVFIDDNKINSDPLSRRIEITIGFIAILQTFLQTGFILDTLKRCTQTKEHIRNKPGREFITALLLINLSIWLHDSISAKKGRLNPFQVAYYDAGTWAIIQAFTSPLSIFYRFHSSVCLADIWQEVFQDPADRDRDRLTLTAVINNNNGIEHD